MIPTIDAAAQRFLNDLARIQDNTDRAQREIGSGLRVATPSDAPDQVQEIVQLHSDIERTSQIASNLGRAKTEVDSADTALQSAIGVVERATVLASDGASSTQSPEARAALSAEVEGLQEQLLSISQTAVEGRYIFSGDRDQAPAYQLDLAAPKGVDRLLTAGATRQIQDTAGNSFGISKTAQELFDNLNPDGTPALNNVFAAMNNLRVALLNNDQPGIVTALASLRSGNDYLNSELEFYGVAQNRIAAASDFAAGRQLQMKADLSDRQDADLTASILALNQGQVQQQAALAARAKIPQRSLFDFLA